MSVVSQLAFTHELTGVPGYSKQSASGFVTLYLPKQSLQQEGIENEGCEVPVPIGGAMCPPVPVKKAGGAAPAITEDDVTSASAPLPYAMLAAARRNAVGVNGRMLG